MPHQAIVCADANNDNSSGSVGEMGADYMNRSSISHQEPGLGTATKSISHGKDDEDSARSTTTTRATTIVHTRRKQPILAPTSAALGGGGSNSGTSTLKIMPCIDGRVGVSTRRALPHSRAIRTNPLATANVNTVSATAELAAAAQPSQSNHTRPVIICKRDGDARSGHGTIDSDDCGRKDDGRGDSSSDVSRPDNQSNGSTQSALTAAQPSTTTTATSTSGSSKNSINSTRSVGAIAMAPSHRADIAGTGHQIQGDDTNIENGNSMNAVYDTTSAPAPSTVSSNSSIISSRNNGVARQMVVSARRVTHGGRSFDTSARADGPLTKAISMPQRDRTSASARDDISDDNSRGDTNVARDGHNNTKSNNMSDSMDSSSANDNTDDDNVAAVDANSCIYARRTADATTATAGALGEGRCGSISSEPCVAAPGSARISARSSQGSNRPSMNLTLASLPSSMSLMDVGRRHAIQCRLEVNHESRRRVAMMQSWRQQWNAIRLSFRTSALLLLKTLHADDDSHDNADRTARARGKIMGTTETDEAATTATVTPIATSVPVKPHRPQQQQQQQQEHRRIGSAIHDPSGLTAPCHHSNTADGALLCSSAAVADDVTSAAAATHASVTNVSADFIACERAHGLAPDQLAAELAEWDNEQQRTLAEERRWVSSVPGSARSTRSSHCDAGGLSARTFAPRATAWTSAVAAAETPSPASTTAASDAATDVAEIRMNDANRSCHVRQDIGAVDDGAPRDEAGKDNISAYRDSDGGLDTHMGDVATTGAGQQNESNLPDRMNTHATEAISQMQHTESSSPQGEQQQYRCCRDGDDSATFDTRIISRPRASTSHLRAMRRSSSPRYSNNYASKTMPSQTHSAAKPRAQPSSYIDLEGASAQSSLPALSPALTPQANEATVTEQQQQCRTPNVERVSELPDRHDAVHTHPPATAEAMRATTAVAEAEPQDDHCPAIAALQIDHADLSDKDDDSFSSSSTMSSASESNSPCADGNAASSASITRSAGYVRALEHEKRQLQHVLHHAGTQAQHTALKLEQCMHTQHSQLTDLSAALRQRDAELAQWQQRHVEWAELRMRCGQEAAEAAHWHEMTATAMRQLYLDYRKPCTDKTCAAHKALECMSSTVAVLREETQQAALAHARLTAQVHQQGRKLQDQEQQLKLQEEQLHRQAQRIHEYEQQLSEQRQQLQQQEDKKKERDQHMHEQEQRCNRQDGQIRQLQQQLMQQECQVQKYADQLQQSEASKDTHSHVAEHNSRVAEAVAQQLSSLTTGYRDEIDALQRALQRSAEMTAELQEEKESVRLQSVNDLIELEARMQDKHQSELARLQSSWQATFARALSAEDALQDVTQTCQQYEAEVSELWGRLERAEAAQRLGERKAQERLAAAGARVREVEEALCELQAAQDEMSAVQRLCCSCSCCGAEAAVAGSSGKEHRIATQENDKDSDHCGNRCIVLSNKDESKDVANACETSHRDGSGGPKSELFWGQGVDGDFARHSSPINNTRSSQRQAAALHPMQYNRNNSESNSMHDTPPVRQTGACARRPMSIEPEHMYTPSRSTSSEAKYDAAVDGVNDAAWSQSKEENDDADEVSMVANQELYHVGSAACCAATTHAAHALVTTSALADMAAERSHSRRSHTASRARRPMSPHRLDIRYFDPTAPVSVHAAAAATVSTEMTSASLRLLSPELRHTSPICEYDLPARNSISHCGHNSSNSHVNRTNSANNNNDSRISVVALDASLVRTMRRDESKQRNYRKNNTHALSSHAYQDSNASYQDMSQVSASAPETAAQHSRTRHLPSSTHVTRDCVSVKTQSTQSPSLSTQGVAAPRWARPSSCALRFSSVAGRLRVSHHGQRLQRALQEPDITNSDAEGDNGTHDHDKSSSKTDTSRHSNCCYSNDSHNGSRIDDHTTSDGHVGTSRELQARPSRVVVVSGRNNHSLSASALGSVSHTLYRAAALAAAADVQRIGWKCSTQRAKEVLPRRVLDRHDETRNTYNDGHNSPNFDEDEDACNCGSATKCDRCAPNANARSATQSYTVRDRGKTSPHSAPNLLQSHAHATRNMASSNNNNTNHDCSLDRPVREDCVFRFTVRLGRGCEDVLIGFADRHLPLESFGATRNSRHYGSRSRASNDIESHRCCLAASNPPKLVAHAIGDDKDRISDRQARKSSCCCDACDDDEASETRTDPRAGADCHTRRDNAAPCAAHKTTPPQSSQQLFMLQVSSGLLYSPARSICDTLYPGWRRALSQSRTAFPGEHVHAHANEHSNDTSSSSMWAARPGDEISCVLYLHKHQICFEHNGVHCGVAFADVDLGVSLYPAVEINSCGAQVELV